MRCKNARVRYGLRTHLWFGSLAVNKTQTVVFTKPHGQTIPLIILEGKAVRLRSFPSYLGVTLENMGVMFKAHLRVASTKTHSVMSALCRLMPIVRGPSEDKRRLYTGAMLSVLMYDAPSRASTVLDAKKSEFCRRIIGGWS